MQPDLERIVVAWAKAESTIGAVVGEGVATRLPKTWTSPFLRVVLIDGSFEVAESSDIATGVIQFDAYAKSSGASPNYTAASLLARTVVAALFAADHEFIAGEGELLGFGIPTLARRVEEPETGWARYMCEASLTARALA